MKIEYTLPGGGRGMRPGEFGMVAEAEPGGRPPRLARLLALAHKLDGLVRSGAVTGYAELARLGHVTPARLTQIMVLLHLTPSIQEYILFQPAGGLAFITELELRQIAREPLWDRQREIFERLLKK